LGDSVADDPSSSWLVGVTVVVVEVVGVECFDDPNPDDPMNGCGCIAAVAVLVVVVIGPPPLSIVVRSAVVVVVLLFPAPPPPDIRPNSILVMGVRGGGGAPPAKGVVMPVPLGVELLRVVDAEEVELAMMDDDGRRGGVRHDDDPPPAPAATLPADSYPRSLALVLLVLAASPLLPLPLPPFRDDDDDVLSPPPPTLIRLRRLLNLPINFL
jgi:hypothetical protein